MNARELAEVLETFQTSYILLDTPGQIELFTFRQSGPVLIDAFGREDSALVYLNDPALVKVASGFVDRSLGDVHPLGNPHYTLDPANIPIVTGTIVAALSRIAPELAAILEANRRAFLDRLTEADRRWKATLAPFRGTRVVSYHDSWPYFYRAFGLVEAGIIEDRPGIPPSPQHLVALIRRMREQGVRVVFVETWYPPAVPNLVAREAGARVLVLPQSPGAVKGTEDYIRHLDHLVTALADALR